MNQRIVPTTIAPMQRESTEANDAHRFSADQRAVMTAFALGATFRPRTWIHTMLAAMEARSESGEQFGTERVRHLMHELSAANCLEEHRQRKGFWRLPPPLDNAVLGATLDRSDFGALAMALRRVEDVDPPDSRQVRGAIFYTLDAAIAVLRLELFSGKPRSKIEKWQNACRFDVQWQEALNGALMSAVQPELLGRLEPNLRTDVLASRIALVLMTWEPDPLPLAQLAADELARRPAAADDLQLRMVFAEYLLCRGQVDDIEAVIQPLQSAIRGEDASYRRALAQAVDGAVGAARANWGEAVALYDAALAALKKETGRRKGLLPEQLLLPYVQSLLAQQSPAQLDKALKICLAEAGQRRATDNSFWGVVALALQIRKGEAPRDDEAFVPHSGIHTSRLDYVKWLMRAWLKEDAAAVTLKKVERQAADALRARLRAVELHRLGDQLDDAINVLTAGAVRPTFFVPAAQERWRVALAALAAIAGPAAKATGSDVSSDRRILWVLALGDSGEIESVVPHEQKRGARGWGRPQALSLAKLSRMAALPPHDAKVARCIKHTPFRGAREAKFDVAAAVIALIGHPVVELADRPGVAVTLIEGTPQIEVLDRGDSLHLAVHPPLRAAPAVDWYDSTSEQMAAEALAATTVLREGTQRAQVVRYSAAQRRAAQLLDQGLAVPKSAAALLQPVLESLGAHFQVHSDVVPGARTVAAESTLRAELTPEGQGLRLRLVVAPLGADGTRVEPGRGRARLIGTVRGETLSVERDLDAEVRSLTAVLEALPLLAAESSEAQFAEFHVPAADDALALLEALPRLAAVQALDWPAGRAISVMQVGLHQLHVQVHSRHDWLALVGSVQVDESLVIGLEQLLLWSNGEHGRFVPLGEGRYLALTQDLRARVADLAAVAELQRDEVKVPALAAAWLNEALDGTQWQSDVELQQRVALLVEAQALQPALPATLQADLRPYQVEGYVWAMRLAAAGLGACLADDMGLGKTLQALAVLLARADGGAALVVVPTSLIGNWQHEARRFAPSLNVQVFGDDSDGDRASQLSRAGARDLLLVSYSLLQLNGEAFAAREWHTLVADEAQALKNAAAKRTQAAQALRAGFRLALSGTPIENRLAELWSIMRICNPGLLGPLARFNERFAAPIERDRDRDAQRILRRLIAPFVLRRTKSQVLDDLPPRTELVLTVQPEAAERAHYEALRRHAVAEAEVSLARGGGQAQISILAQLTRLRRAACDPRLVSPQLGIVGAKVQSFTELATELAANNHKALVFSQFVDFLTLLREPLDAAGISYQYLDGATPAAERTRRVAAFQAGEGALFLISLKAGGFGLNLTLADYVVIADPWWNPAAEDQASGRAHRIGQRRPVTVYRLVSAGTLEESIVDLHRRKRDLADGVLEGAEAAGALDAQVLIELIRGDRASGGQDESKAR